LDYLLGPYQEGRFSKLILGNLAKEGFLKKVSQKEAFKNYFNPILKKKFSSKQRKIYNSPIYKIDFIEKKLAKKVVSIKFYH